MANKIIISKDNIENLSLPEGYEIVKKPDPNQAILDEIARLEEQLAQMSEPDEKELILYGKMSHPYYDLMIRIDMLKDELKKF